MNREPDTPIRQIEFELEKAERGLGMPYDGERAVAQHAPRGTQAETVRGAEGETGAGMTTTLAVPT